MKWLQMFWEIFRKSQQAGILARLGRIDAARRIMTS